MAATATCELKYEPVTKPRMTVKQFLKLKPSALLRVAIDDLAWVEKQQGLKVNMGHWMDLFQSRCLVCFAGSVMARTFGARPNEGGLSCFVTPANIDGVGVTRRLSALNYARQGRLEDYLEEGFNRSRIPAPFRDDGEFVKVKVKAYSKTNSAQFKRDMRRIARLLESHGL